jgi:hypothetical protein
MDQWVGKNKRYNTGFVVFQKYAMLYLEVVPGAREGRHYIWCSGAFAGARLYVSYFGGLTSRQNYGYL